MRSAMTAAALPSVSSFTTSPAPLVLPRELAEMLGEDQRLRDSFDRLPDRDRRNFCTYVAEAALTATRERRAAFVAMSLAGLSANGSP